MLFDRHAGRRGKLREHNMALDEIDGWRARSEWRCGCLVNVNRPVFQFVICQEGKPRRVECLM
jgi:hypothetical protein